MITPNEIERYVDDTVFSQLLTDNTRGSYFVSDMTIIQLEYLTFQDINQFINELPDRFPDFEWSVERVLGPQTGYTISWRPATPST